MDRKLTGRPPAGNALRKWRFDHDLTQEDFAAKVGTYGTRISNYENGVSTPDLRMATKIQKLTGIPAPAWVDASMLDSAGEAA